MIVATGGHCSKFFTCVITKRREEKKREEKKRKEKKRKEKKRKEKHNILQVRASRFFSAVQKSIQQHPRSIMLDSHDL
jgi:3-hydroxy-3-methylglutaryl CoA synthase